MGERRTKIDVTPEITRQMATRRAVGASLADLEKEFGYSRPVITRTLSSDVGRAVIKGLTDDAVSAAVVEVRKRFSDLTTLVGNVVEQQLKEGSLEAVKVVLKTLGVDAAEKQEVEQQQSITVILPGSQAPKEVKNGDIEI